VQLIVLAPFTYQTNQGQRTINNYSKSHIVTCDQYIHILQKKAIDKSSTKEIEEVK
jgi:hypothetical protein